MFFAPNAYRLAYGRTTRECVTHLVFKIRTNIAKWPSHYPNTQDHFRVVPMGFVINKVEPRQVYPTALPFPSKLSVDQHSTLTGIGAAGTTGSSDIPFSNKLSLSPPLKPTERTQNSLSSMKPEYPYGVRYSQPLIPPSLGLRNVSPSTHKLFLPDPV